MPQFKIYTAMLSSSKIPVLKGEIWEAELKTVKDMIPKIMNLNPFYCIISDVTNKEVVYNQHVKISFPDLQKYD